MKWKVITLSLLIFLFMSCSSAVNYQAPLEKSESQISTYNVAVLEPLVKGSSGGRSSSSSSSSSSKKIDTDDDVDTGTDDGSTPWWLIALILVFVGVIAVVVIWYLFLRK